MSNYTILLIDYEPKSIDRVRRPLMGIGYRVEVATDGISGIEAFHRLKPDLVMVEAMIPRKHGFEVCQEIKKSPQGKRTPVIITTSVYKGRKYRNQAFHLHGCDEYIEKPIDEEQVVTICRRMVGDNGPIQSIPSMAAAEPFESDAPFESASGDGMMEDAAPTEFPPVPPAPPGLDEDEFEIMSKLDSILSGPLGGGGGKGPAAPAPVAPAPQPTVASAPPAQPRDMFATSFFPASDATHNQDMAPRPMGSTATATVTEAPHFLVPIGESPDQNAAFLDDNTAAAGSANDASTSESHRSKRKERRKKGSAAPAPRASDSEQPPSIPELSPSRDAFASADLPPAPTFAEPDAPASTQLRTDPFESTVVEDDEKGSRWFIVGVVVVLVGAAVALFLYMR